MIFKTWKLKPINSSNHREYYENVLVLEDNYPVALMHIDTWYSAKPPRDIFEKLESGEDVTVEVRFLLIEEK